MLERNFQQKLIKELKNLGFTVWKNQQNATTETARPDLLVLKGVFWGCLEVKKERLAKHRPLQDVKVLKYNQMSYAAFVYPENKDQIINQLLLLADERNKVWDDHLDR